MSILNLVKVRLTELLSLWLGVRIEALAIQFGCIKDLDQIGILTNQ